MSATVIDFEEFRTRRLARRSIHLSEKPGHVCVPVRAGFAWLPRSEFSAKELSDIDFFKRECGL
jgi:hypothetical protein